MGVSIEIYRCRIGGFNLSGPCCASATKTSNAGLGLLMQILCACTLFVILLVGGIELNPGPEHKCKFCKGSFISNAMYFDHMVIHQSISNKTGVPCSQKGCKSIVSSVQSLCTHMSKFHAKKKTPSTTFMIVCPADGCQEVFTDFSLWKVHAERQHLVAGITFKCLFKPCQYVCKNVAGLRSHLSRYHPGKPETLFHEVAVVRDVPNLVDVDDDMDDNDGMPYVENTEEDDPYPPNVIMDRLARFYLTLEAHHVLPTSTVQIIAEEIALLSRFSHHRLKRALKEELKKEGVEDSCSRRILSNVFTQDTVFNTHHKGLDSVQFSTDHLRSVYWKMNFKFVPPVPVDLGQAEGGKKKVAQLIPIRESLSTMLEDESVHTDVVKSFSANIGSPEILADFVDGSQFQHHMESQHEGSSKCIQILLFQDGFDPNAFSTGNHKPIGFYYTIGNIAPERRLSLNLIQLAYMVLEKDLKTSLEEELNDVDKLKLALEPLIKELVDLKSTGVSIDGEIVPVCLLYLIGDSLGQNFIANIVRNFSNAEFSCRFCPMPRSTFLRVPWEIRDMRTPQQYNRNVSSAKIMWSASRREALKQQDKRKRNAKKRIKKVAARCSAPSKKDITSMISKNAYEKLVRISQMGVKYRPCPFNHPGLGFHIIGAQPPCISHDLHEGIFKAVLPRILKYFIQEKEWFDLKKLNSRIVSFKCLGTDCLDRPKPLKNLKSLSGHAVENWNLVRLLPFIIGDLIQDKEDEYWQIYLQLQEISQLVSAPRISRKQVLNVLSELINKYLRNMKQFLKQLLTPKHHYLAHYPCLILMFGPLIRLFTLRFESKHAFFKKVMRSCNNFINVTFTMSRKYACRAALDRATNLIPDQVVLCSSPSVFDRYLVPEPARPLISHQMEHLKEVKIYGTKYRSGLLLLLGGTYEKLKVGEIVNVLWDPVKCEVSFLVMDSIAKKVHGGGYHKLYPRMSYQLVHATSLPDYHPLSAYRFQDSQCLVLKHTSPFMHE